MKKILFLSLLLALVYSVDAREIIINGNYAGSGTGTSGSGPFVLFRCNVSSAVCAKINVPDNPGSTQRVTIYNSDGVPIESFDALSHTIEADGQLTTITCLIP
jgi:hypothetical protein